MLEVRLERQRARCAQRSLGGNEPNVSGEEQKKKETGNGSLSLSLPPQLSDTSFSASDPGLTEFKEMIWSDRILG